MKKTKKTKKIIKIISLSLVLILAIGLFVGGNYLYNLAINPKTPKDMIFGHKDNAKEVVSINETSGTVNIPAEDWLANYSNYKDLYRTSKDGLKLHNYLLNKDNSHKWVIAVHGYTTEGKKMAKYAKNFYDKGYNVIMPDLRGQGKSEGNYIGMGWDERFDIIDLVNYIVKTDPNSQIMLYGVSMGAATVMNVSGENISNHVKAIVEDCGYTSVWDEFSMQLKSLFNLPSFPMLNVASLITKVKAGYWLGDASPITQVEKSKVPILFIHGDSDAFVPSYMVNKLYDACKAPKEKLIIKGAAHAKSVDVNPSLYWSAIDNFSSKYIN